METQTKDETALVSEASGKDEHIAISKNSGLAEIESKETEAQNKSDSLHVDETEDNIKDVKYKKAVETGDEEAVIIKAEVQFEELTEDESFDLSSETPEQSILKARLQGLLPDSEIIVGSGEFPTFNHFMTSLDDTSSCLCLCHIERKPPESKLYRCGTCEELLCCKCLWQAHNIAHKNHTRFVCHTCGKAYHYRSDLKRHLAVHELIKPHKCEVCDRHFNQVGHLMTHRLTHTGEKPFLCDICGKAFNRKSNLLKHKLVHSGDRPFVCDQCNSTFTRKGDLGRHRLLHTGEKPFPCTLCDKAFTQKPHLVNHQSVHTGVKPFVCEWCDKSFNRKSNLLKHKKCHFKGVESEIRNNRYYTCEHCNATFFDQNALEEHREEHGNTDVYSCSLCNKSFSHKPLLVSHQGTHHNVQPFTCSFCNKTFNSSIFFRKHQTAHVKRLINRKDHDLIFKTVNIPENLVSVKGELTDDPFDDGNLLTEESCSSQTLRNSESSVDCDNITFIRVAELLKVGHRPTAETLKYPNRKKGKHNLVFPEKDRRECNENVPVDDCSSSSEDSQFRLLSALQLQVTYNKPKDSSSRSNNRDDKSAIENLTSDNPVGSTETASSISKTVVRATNVPEMEQRGDILRKILCAAEPFEKIGRNKSFESKHCVNGDKTTWKALTINK